MPPKGSRKKGATASTPGPARNAATSSSSTSEADDQPSSSRNAQRETSPFQIPAWLNENSAVHVLNPDIGSSASLHRAYLAPPAPHSDSSNQQGLVESNVVHAVPGHPSALPASTTFDAPPHGQPQRRRSLSADHLISNLQQDGAAPQGNQLPPSSANDILRALRSAHSSEVLQQVRAALNRAEVIIIDDSPSRPQASPQGNASALTADQLADVSDNQHSGGGVKRLQPGNPSTSSSSVASSDNATSAAITLAAPATAPISSAILSPRRASVVTKCPVCLVTSDQWQEGHNPMHCVYVNGPRSALEQEQVTQLHATRRILQSLGSEDRFSYAGLDSSSTSHSPSPSDYLPAPHSSASRSNMSAAQPHRTYVNPTTSSRVALPHRAVGGGGQSPVGQETVTQGGSAPRPVDPRSDEGRPPAVDPRIRAARDAERAAYAAGVDNVRSSEERSHDTHDASGSEYSSSEYQPSSLGRSSSTGGSEPKWVSSFRHTQESAMANIRSELSTLMAQVTQLAQTQVHLQHQVNRQHPVAPMPFPMQPAPFMPYPGIPFMQPFQPAPPHAQHAPDDFQDSVPPLAHNHRVNFADMVGVNSPSMMHTARPRSGMHGAPDLAPEDIGNVHKFNEFLKQYSQYAAKARDQGSTWTTVAGLLARYAEDLGIAFTACAMKRGERTAYTTDSVLQLSDAQFEKLYVEACFPSVEFPSQVLEALEATVFRRQHAEETNPLHPVMRAAEAFRVQLRLLPGLAVQQCSPEGIMIAFFRLLFGEEAKRRRMDFQQCNDWEQARTALITRATVHPSWFGDCLRERATQVPHQPRAVQSSASNSSVKSPHMRHPPPIRTPPSHCHGMRNDPLR